jgi:glyoxylase-like metal-dependent hydrolase (beta-lactamase superfamily II)
LFMPDYGTARCDFPGGDARQLYRSIQTILALPPQTRLFLCHDYLPPGRTKYRWKTTVAEQRAHNIQINEGVSEISSSKRANGVMPHSMCQGSSFPQCKSTCGPGSFRQQKTMASATSRFR